MTDDRYDEIMRRFDATDRKIEKLAEMVMNGHEGRRDGDRAILDALQVRGALYSSWTCSNGSMTIRRRARSTCATLRRVE